VSTDLFLQNIDICLLIIQYYALNNTIFIINTIFTKTKIVTKVRSSSQVFVQT